MSTFNEIQAALAASVQAYEPGLNVFGYEPRTFIPPAAIVRGQTHRTIRYRQAGGGSRFAEWHFAVLLVIGQVDEAAAQQMAGDLITPGSDLIQALNRTKLSNGYVQVTEGLINTMTVTTGPSAASLYTYAQLSVLVQA